MKEKDYEESQLKVELIKVAYKMRRVHISALLGDVIHSEYYALDQIYQYEKEHPDTKGIYVSELAKCLRIASSAASRLLNSMETKGYIVRETDRGDRRNTYVRLSDRGLQIHNEDSARMDEFQERVISRMGDKDIRKLIELWNRLTDVMEVEVEAMKSNLEQQQKEG